MHDLIERQAAIDAILAVTGNSSVRELYEHVQEHGLSDMWSGGVNAAIDIIIAVPSAQPEKRTEERTETHACDLIDRQAAIDALTRKMVSIPTAGEKDLMGDLNRIRTEDISVIRRLPTAQPELIRINLNEPIKVKLTDWGKEIYYHQYDRTNQIAGREICKPRFPREDENGYTEFQLWCFIELYGMHMGMTLPNVIEPLEIVYER